MNPDVREHVQLSRGYFSILLCSENCSVILFFVYGVNASTSTEILFSINFSVCSDSATEELLTLYLQIQ